MGFQSGYLLMFLTVRKKESDYVSPQSSTGLGISPILS